MSEPTDLGGGPPQPRPRPAPARRRAVCGGGLALTGVARPGDQPAVWYHGPVPCDHPGDVRLWTPDPEEDQ